MAEEKEKPNTTEDATGPSSVLEKIYTYYTGERLTQIVLQYTAAQIQFRLIKILSETYRLPG